MHIYLSCRHTASSVRSAPPQLFLSGWGSVESYWTDKTGPIIIAYLMPFSFPPPPHKIGLTTGPGMLQIKGIDLIVEIDLILGWEQCVPSYHPP